MEAHVKQRTSAWGRCKADTSFFHIYWQPSANFRARAFACISCCCRPRAIRSRCRPVESISAKQADSWDSLDLRNKMWCIETHYAICLAGALTGKNTCSQFCCWKLWNKTGRLRKLIFAKTGFDQTFAHAKRTIHQWFRSTPHQANTKTTWLQRES